ncbi:FAD:protein FMN transferase [Neobacillus sp. Marseille-QA0830]
MTVKHEDLNGFETISFDAMNTEFFISVQESGLPNWQEVIYRWVKHAENEWSRFREDSELQQVNRLRVRHKLSISPPLFDCLQRAEEYRVLTEGRFSPYLQIQMAVHGYDRPFPFDVSPVSAVPVPPVNWKKTAPFTFNPQSSAVERCDEGNIDLGGIGKGYAVQAAANWLKMTGAKSGIIDGGGDMAVWSYGDKEWRIGVAHPFDERKEIAQFRIKNGGIATSNIIYRSWRQGASKKHHLLNGQTGCPVDSDLIQATVITKNCVDAEVMAKMCFMEKDSTLNKLLKSIQPAYSLILVRNSGKITIV